MKRLSSFALAFLLGVGLSALRTEWPAVDLRPMIDIEGTGATDPMLIVEIQDGTLPVEYGEIHILGNALDDYPCVITGGEGDRTQELQEAIRNCHRITLKRGAGQSGGVVKVGTLTIPSNVAVDATDGTGMMVREGGTLTVEGQTLLPVPMQLSRESTFRHYPSAADVAAYVGAALGQ